MRFNGPSDHSAVSAKHSSCVVYNYKLFYALKFPAMIEERPTVWSGVCLQTTVDRLRTTGRARNDASSTRNNATRYIRRK